MLSLSGVPERRICYVCSTCHHTTIGYNLLWAKIHWEFLIGVGCLRDWMVRKCPLSSAHSSHPGFMTDYRNISRLKGIIWGWIIREVAFLANGNLLRLSKSVTVCRPSFTSLSFAMEWPFLWFFWKFHGEIGDDVWYSLFRCYSILVLLCVGIAKDWNVLCSIIN